MSQPSQTATSYQNSSPWSAQQPYLKSGFQQAQNIYNQGAPQYYPGTTVANQSPATQAYQQGATARGLNGSPVNAAASGYLQNVLGGQYLSNGNPYDDAVFKSISDKVTPQVAAQFSMGGRYGSPDMGAELTTALTNAYAPYAFGQYQQERGNQQAAASMAPNQAAQDWTDLAGVNAAGQSQDTQAQNLVNANVQHWNYNQNLPMNWLQQYMGLIGGNNYGSQGTTTQTIPSQGFNWGGLLGGVLGGIL